MGAIARRSESAFTGHLFGRTVERGEGEPHAPAYILALIGLGGVLVGLFAM